MTTADHRATLDRLRDEARRHREYAERYAADAARYVIEHYADLWPERVTVDADGVTHLDPFAGCPVSDAMRAAGHVAARLGRPVVVTFNGTTVTMTPTRDPADAVAEYLGTRSS